jgi:hypothetical protein
VSSPLRNAAVSGESLHVAWSSIGKPIEHVTIEVDGQPVLQEVQSTSAEVPLADLATGSHTVTVIANGAVTRYPLSWTEFDTCLDASRRAAVAVTVPFTRL